MIRIPRLGDWIRLGQGPYAGSDVITYLLDVVFADYPDDPAPVASPIVGRSGQLTVVETDGTFAITSGQLVFTAQSTPVFGDQGFKGDMAFVRNAGLVFLTTLTLTTTTSSDRGYYGFAQDGNLSSVSITNSSMYANNSIAATSIDARVSGTTSLAVGTFAASTIYQYAIVANHFGAIHLIKGGGFTDWTLLWKAAKNTTTPVYPSFINFLLAGSFGLCRVANLPANATYPVPALGTRDLDLCTPGTGTGTSSITSPAVGNTFVHTADTLITFDLTTLPSAGQVQIFIRANAFTTTDEWRVDVNSSGNLALYEGDGIGGFVTRGTSLGAVSSGSTISVLAVGSTIELFVSGVLKITYASANAYITQTAGKVQSIGTGGVIANLTAKTMDGVANVSSSNHPGYGLATSVLPGPRSAGDTFTHEVDCVWEFQLDALPSANFNRILFRSDGTNMLGVSVSLSGSIGLWSSTTGEGGLGAVSVVGSVLSGGERLVIVASGSSIKIYYNTTLAISYSTSVGASNTSGKIQSLTNGMKMSNLIAWPLSLAAAANTPEAANVKAAFDLMATP